jgi:hypothetical protein
VQGCDPFGESQVIFRVLFDGMRFVDSAGAYPASVCLLSSPLTSSMLPLYCNTGFQD